MTDAAPDEQERALVLRQAAEDAIAELGKWEMLAEHAEHDVAAAIAEHYAAIWRGQADELRSELQALQASIEEDADA